MTIFEQMDELLTPETWIQGLSAVDKQGYMVDPKNLDACKFCIFGAFSRCKEYDNNFHYPPEWIALCNSSWDLFSMDPISVNDQLGFNAVKQLLQKAKETA